jgi:cellulose 1,4-beta-cellobiosidase
MLGFTLNGTACGGSGPANQAPTVTLTSPPADQTFPEGGAVALAASAADPDGAIARVDFLIDGAVVGTDTSAPYGAPHAGRWFPAQFTMLVQNAFPELPTSRRG